jgi:hypothetical protein
MLLPFKVSMHDGISSERERKRASEREIDNERERKRESAREKERARASKRAYLGKEPTCVT